MENVQNVFCFNPIIHDLNHTQSSYTYCNLKIIISLFIKTLNLPYQFKFKMSSYGCNAKITAIELRKNSKNKNQGSLCRWQTKFLCNYLSRN